MKKIKYPELKICTSIRELRKAYNEIQSTTAGDVRFCVSANLFMATKLDEIHSLIHQEVKQLIRIANRLSQKRQPTQYQLKVGQYLKEGKSLQEAHRLARGEE